MTALSEPVISSEAIAEANREKRDRLDKLAVLGQISEVARHLEAEQVVSTRHRDGTGRPNELDLARVYRRLLQDMRGNGSDTWNDELRAAMFTVAGHREWTELREALLEVAGTCVNWILEGDRRG